MKRIIIPLFILFLIALFQVSVASVFVSFPVLPNFLLVISLALWYSKNIDLFVLAMFFSGLFLDIFSVHDFGVLSMAYSGLSVIVLLANKWFGRNIILATFAVFTSSMVLRVVLSGFTAPTGNVLLESLVNFLIFMAIYPVIKYINQKLVRSSFFQLTFKDI